MDATTARTRLQRMVQDTVTPTLSSAEVDDLLMLSRRSDPAGNAPEQPWVASTFYQVGDRVVPAVNNGHVYTVTVAGVSGTVQPTFPTLALGIVVDNQITWQEAGAYQWSGTYALKWAAAEGWRWKAAKVSDQYDVVVGTGYQFTRDQLLKHCLTMAAEYSKSVVGSFQVETAATELVSVGGIDGRLGGGLHA